MKTESYLHHIAMLSADERKLARSYASYVKAKTDVFKQITTVLINAQLELATRSTALDAVEVETVGITSIDTSQVPQTSLAVCQALLDKQLISGVEYERMLSDLTLGSSLADAIPQYIVDAGSLSREGLAQYYFDAYSNYQSPTPEFVEDFSVEDFLYDFDMSPDACFTTQDGEVITLRSALDAIVAQQYLPDGHDSFVFPLVGAPKSVNSVMEDVINTLQTTKVMELSLDALSNNGAVAMTEIMAHMQSEFEVISPAAIQYASMVSSALSDTFNSVVSRVSAILMPIRETENTIQSSTVDGILVSVSNDYSGASPSAAWLTNAHLPSLNPQAVVDGIKSTFIAASSFIRKATHKVKGLVDKGIEWVESNVLEADDIYVLDATSLDKSVNVPTFQAKVPTSTLVSDLKSLYPWLSYLTTDIFLSRFGGGSVVEILYPFATIKIVASYTNTTIVISLTPTTPIAEGAGVTGNRGYFKRVYSPEISFDAAFESLFGDDFTVVNDDSADKVMVQGFKASLIRLIFWLGLLHLNLEHQPDTYFASYSTDVAELVGGLGSDPDYPYVHMGFLEATVVDNDPGRESNIYSNSGFADTNLGLIKTLLADFPVLTAFPPGPFTNTFPYALFASILGTSTQGQLAFYNAFSDFVPFLPYTIVNDVSKPRFGLKTDTDNAKIITKIITTTLIVAAVIVVGVISIKVLSSIKGKLRARMGENERQLWQLYGGSSPITSKNGARTINKLLRQRRRIERASRLLGLAAPAAVAGFSLRSGMTDSMTGITDIRSGTDKILKILG